jgi:hypothetical protein
MYKTLISLQREFFSIAEELVECATGQKAAKISSAQSALKVILATIGDSNAVRVCDCVNRVILKLVAFYNAHGTRLAACPSEVGGLKLLAGGGSISDPHVEAARQTLLYADTILLPDPILPWLERHPLDDDSFPSLKLLGAAASLLPLKPLIDADLPYPAVLIVPGFEQSLINQDAERQKQSIDFVNRFFGAHLERPFSGPDELDSYWLNHESEFLDKVERKKLFMPHGSKIQWPLRKAIRKYRNSFHETHTDDYTQRWLDAPDGLLVSLEIVNNLTGQFVLLTRTEDYGAQPLLALKRHWHYFSLCAEAFSDDLLDKDLIQRKTVAILRALGETEHQWLTKVPMDALVMLRQDDATKEFRTRLDSFAKELNDASLEQVDRVSAEVGRAIASLLADHDRRVGEIERKYQRLHKVTAAASWIGLAATLVPALAPFIAPLIGAPSALKYIKDKVNERGEKHEAARSLVGVLAATEQTFN